MPSFISSHYEITGLAILATLLMVPPVLSIAALLDFVRSRVRRAPCRRWLAYSAIICDAVLAVCTVDAWLVEPGYLSVTRVTLRSPHVLMSTGAIKIVHISDVHFVKATKLTSRVLSTVSREQPDLICITGDMYDPDGYDEAQFGEFMTRLCSNAPSYYVCGYDSEVLISRASTAAILAGPHARRLRIRGTAVDVGGVPSRCGVHRIWSDGSLRVSMAHTPDMIDDAAASGADLFLAGHTHGGQVRLPFWGAIMTNCDTGKRYEYGLYHKGRMRAFVTRGVGLEPAPAPQVRFLCRPEIAVIRVCAP